MPDDGISACEQARKLREGALPVWRPQWEARTENRAFLDGDRYEESNNLANRDPRRQQFRGSETSDNNRWLAAQTTATPRQLEALPVDRMSDPVDGEVAVSLLEWELNNPLKGFDDVDEEVVNEAVDCRAGAAMLHWDPDIGPYGELYWLWQNPNLVMFEPGFADPHHPACGWMQTLHRMSKHDIKRMGELKGKAKWNVPKEIHGDSATAAVSSRQTSGVLSTQGAQLLGVPNPPTDDDHQWVLFCWYKNDPTTYKRQKQSREIPKGQQYLACDNPECDYRTDTQDQMIQEEKVPGGYQLPEVGEDPCPQCGSTISLRSQRSEEEDVLYYARGRRLLVFPLLQMLPDDEPYYDGDWPVPTARSFPIYWLTRYVRAGRAMGDCDTERHWDSQVASDQMLTMAFRRVMEHQNYYTLPLNGAFDFQNNAFEFRSEQFNVIRIDYSNANIPPPGVGVVAGSALDPSWGQHWNAIQQTLLGQRAKSDLGLTPDRTKDIAASTVAQLTQQGNIPLEHFKRRRSRALSKAFGVMWDYIRHVYTRARLARLNLWGEQIVERLRGDELPNYDFQIVEAPAFNGLEEARQKAAQVLIQTATEAPEWLDLIAEINNFPPSIVRRVKQQIKQQQDEEQRQAELDGMLRKFSGPPGVNAMQMLNGSSTAEGAMPPAQT